MENVATNNRNFMYPAMKFLMRHTVMIGATHSRCGNCGKNVLPHETITCVVCGNTWVYMTASYAAVGESLAETKRDMEARHPMYEFIGIATRSAMAGEELSSLDLQLSTLG